MPVVAVPEATVSGLSAPEASAPKVSVPDMRGSYDSYISSGLYDRRYPRPNRRTLRHLLSCLPADGRFLDVGAGTGRYTLPLLERSRATGVAQDICPSACRTLKGRLTRFSEGGRLSIRGEEVARLESEYAGTFDLAVLAFGVLGHISGRAERLRTLRSVRRMLTPEGVLVLSLPNARRRFRAEQRVAAPLVHTGALEAGDILYTRGEGAAAIRMFYHLYTLAEAREDLLEAGYRTERIEPESLLAEETAVRQPLLGLLDAIACRVVPAFCGYGFLIVARPATAPGG